MRCEKCRIDLPESYEICPLCEGKPANIQAKLKVCTYVPYSKEVQKETVPFVKEKLPFCKEKLRAYFNL